MANENVTKVTIDRNATEQQLAQAKRLITASDKFKASNTFKVTIDGKDYTRNTIFPIKWSKLLDERLDETRLCIKRLKRNIIHPLTPATVTMTDKKGRQITLDTIVTTDETAEVPVGNGTFDHEIMCLEQTKILEGIVVDALTFTNDLGRNYTANAKTVTPDAELSSPTTSREPVVIERIKNPMKADMEFTFPSVAEVFNSSNLPIVKNEIKIQFNGATVFYSKETVDSATSAYSYPNNTKFTTVLQSGTYVLTCYIDKYVGGDTTATYTFTVVQNVDPLPKWSITSVIKRILDVAEPHLVGESPRYHLNAAQAEAFAKIDAFDFIDTPEFMLPSGTLREDLDIIGGYIHGMARLKGDEIYYDMFDSTTQAKIADPKYKYISNMYSQDIESYCSGLDSTVDNLVCSLDDAQGTITEPYDDGYETVRTETVYARIEEGNMFIATQFPIQEIKRVRMGIIIPDPLGGGYFVKDNNDITAYIFESAEYGRLSSYKDQYPEGKSYALYYTQGKKNIYGLNFKVPDATGGALKNYAIVNISNAVFDANDSSLNYPLLSFQVEYVPIFRARVQQTKPYIKGYKQPRALCYNQGANLVETRYYGENLKGAVARMGNVDRIVTYNLGDFSLIPEIGEMYGDDYYIAGVTCELQPNLIKCMLTLSQDFNRLSQYIGINSVQRFYEVSEKQAYARDMKYADYVVIGDEAEQDTTLASMSNIAETFTQSGSTHSVSHVVATGVKDSGESAGGATVLLPAVSTALGNAMVFTFTYKDNYSAGAQSQYESAGGTSGYFTNDVAYGDYYGRFPALKFDMCTHRDAPATGNAAAEICTKLPQWDGGAGDSAVISTPADKPLRVDKNGAEILSVNYVLEFVTNRKSYVIGSALARNCPLVRGTDSERSAALYVLPNRISKFAARVSLSGATKIADYSGGAGLTVSGKSMKFADFMPSVDGLAWVIATKTGEVLIGSNEPITAGQTVTMPYMTLRHDIFNLGGNNQ